MIVNITGKSAGIIFSKIPPCNGNETSPKENFKGVYTLTTVAIKLPTTVNPIIEADSVNALNFSDKSVIKRVPELYPILYSFTLNPTNNKLKRIQIIAPKGFPSNAIYPPIDPIIVGYNTHNTESPIPANGPINDVFIDRTASKEDKPFLSCIATSAPIISGAT